MTDEKENGPENRVLEDLWCDIVRTGGERFKVTSSAGIITRLLFELIPGMMVLSRRAYGR